MLFFFNLPETNSKSPLRIGIPDRKVVFQPSILGAMLVSGKVKFLTIGPTMKQKLT